MFDLLATTTRRKFLFACLYLSEGAPIGFIWMALPTRLRSEGVSIEQITWLTATLVLPWTFKFAWAPLVDVLRGRWWTLKHWIVAAQLLMGVTLLPLLWVDVQLHFTLVAGVLLVHAFSAATQDVAIDALCISLTQPGERGRFNGWMQAGMLLGRAGLGGGALILAEYLGEAAVIVLLVAVIWSSLLMLLMSRLPDEAHASENIGAASSWQRAVAAAVIAARQPATWFALTFALVGGAAYEGTGAIAGPLLVDQGLSRPDIGYFLGVPAMAAMIFGSLVGGRLADRLDRRKAVATSMLVIVAAAALAGLSIAPLNVLPDAPETRGILLAYALTAIYFGIGLFVASSYALFMDVTTPGVAATQFSAFMGATNGCEAWSVFAIGRLAGMLNYSAAIWLMCLPSLAALQLLFRLRPRSAAADEDQGPG